MSSSKFNIFRDDTESHVRAALEVAWERSAGDWTVMLNTMRRELAMEGEETVKWMKIAVKTANQLSEAQIKKMIQDYDTPNSVPKLNKKKAQGFSCLHTIKLLFIV